LGNLLQELELASSSGDWERVDALVIEITAEQGRVTDLIESRGLAGPVAGNSADAAVAAGHGG